MVARYMGEQGILLKNAYERAAQAGTLNGRNYQDFATEVPGYVCGAFGLQPDLISRSACIASVAI